jgi:predicted nucleotide-binding protein
LTPDELREFLTKSGVRFLEEPIQHATQFRCSNGETFAVYNSGKVVLGGKRSDLSQAVEALEQGAVADGMVHHSGAPLAAAPPVPTIFIVYGHDETARDALELLLRRMGFEPIILARLAAAGDTIIEKLERYLGEHGDVGFACVLLTPDDEGHRATHSEEKRYRARQNVILELGMVLTRLGRRRVAILHKQSIELPSDIAGLIYIAFQERVEELTAGLFKELQSAGYEPNLAAL